MELVNELVEINYKFIIIAIILIIISGVCIGGAISLMGDTGKFSRNIWIILSLSLIIGGGFLSFIHPVDKKYSVEGEASLQSYEENNRQNHKGDDIKVVLKTDDGKEYKFIYPKTNRLAQKDKIGIGDKVTIKSNSKYQVKRDMHDGWKMTKGSYLVKK